MSETEEGIQRHSLLETLQGRGGLLLVLAVAAALRLHELGRWWINPDEGIYFSIVTRETFAGFWAEVMENAHPPLYYLILRALGYVTWDYVVLRAFSVLCGVAAVVGVWAAARELSLAVTEPPRGPDEGETGWVAAAPDARAVRRADWAGLLAAGMLAVAPGAVLLSQVMRPYMLQVALLAGALTFLLRYRRCPDTRSLATYLVLVILALLTHYSSVLGLGAFAAVVAFDGTSEGGRRPAWRRLVAWHLLPAAIVTFLYLTHVRTLATSEMADFALNGWLSGYMIDSLGDAWLRVLEYQSMVGAAWMRGPFLLLLLAVPLLAIRLRQAPAAVLVLGAIVIALVGAWMHVYPLGGARHAAWLMALTVPAVGWVVAAVLTLPEARGKVGALALVSLVAAGGPVSDLLGGDQIEWTPAEQLLERANMARMLDVVDPEAGPELILLSEQAFYLLVPFYPHERESAVRSADGTLYTFEYGDRDVLVSSAWDLKADSASDDPDHIARVLAVAAESFPQLDLSERATASFLVGGWIPPALEGFGSPPLPEPVMRSLRSVPGLVAMDLDLDAVRRIFGAAGAGERSFAFSR